MNNQHTGNGHNPPPGATINLDPAHVDPDPPDDEGRVLVDSVAAQRPPRPTLADRQAAKRRPILPAWLRSRAELADTARWAIGHTLHTSAYHTTRGPVYAGRLAARTPRGAARILSGIVRWTRDAEGLPVRLAAVRREDAETYLKLSRQRDARVRLRTTITVVAAVLAAVGLAGLLAAPDWAVWLTLTVLVVVCGVAGAPADRPLLDTAVVRHQVARLTSDRVVAALKVLALAGINQAVAKEGDKAIGFDAPITRDGPGWRADIDLPPGVTAGDVIERRDRLASGLARPLGCVWPEGAAHIHPGRLVLWVGDQDMATARQPAWPLAKHGSTDLFRPFPFGTDQRGRPVTVTLMFASMVIGSIPRMGKTFAARLLLLGAALDVRAELHVYDLKGMGDFAMLEPVAHRYRAGEEDEDIAYLLDDFRELKADLRRRTRTIRNLPRDICPENKITPELASNRTLGLHPVVIVVDECHKGFEHPIYGKELTALGEDFTRQGPAAGIQVIWATQRPDTGSLPGAISANAVLRFCLKVMDHTANDMVLGTGAHKAGVRATMFTRDDLGIGYLVGEGADPQTIRTYYLDAPAAERIIARARAARQAAGRLTGHALGEQPTTPQGTGSDLLADILAVVAEAEAKVWNETVIRRLAELRPEVYGHLVKPEQLTLALKPYGITVGQVWGTDPDTGEDRNRNGITRAHIVAAIAERDRHRKAS